MGDIIYENIRERERETEREDLIFVYKLSVSRIMFIKCYFSWEICQLFC